MTIEEIFCEGCYGVQDIRYTFNKKEFDFISDIIRETARKTTESMY